MARGWESKAVEAQQEEASRRQPAGPPPTADQRARAERRRTLELSRSRVQAELERAAAPAHRRMLEEAMAVLDRELAALA